MCVQIYSKAYIFCFLILNGYIISLNLLKIICIIPFVKSIIKFFYQKNSQNIEKELFGIKFKNPVGLAAGFDKNGKYIKELSLFGFSFIEVGTVTQNRKLVILKKDFLE